MASLHVKVVGNEEGVCWGKDPASWIRDPWGEPALWPLHDLLSHLWIGKAIQKDPPEHWTIALCLTKEDFVFSSRETTGMVLDANKVSSIDCGWSVVVYFVKMLMGSWR